MIGGINHTRDYGGPYMHNVPNIQNGAGPDFTTGVTAVLIEKVRDARPQWSPDSLDDVDVQAVQNKFFDPNSQFIKPFAPTLELPAVHTVNKAKINPQTYALPSEAEIEQIVRGTHLQSGGVALSVDEVVQKFVRMRQGKRGVEAKVREVCARRCEVDKSSGSHECLRWKNTA